MSLVAGLLGWSPDSYSCTPWFQHWTAPLSCLHKREHISTQKSKKEAVWWLNLTWNVLKIQRQVMPSDIMIQKENICLQSKLVKVPRAGCPASLTSYIESLQKKILLRNCFQSSEDSGVWVCVWLPSVSLSPLELQLSVMLQISCWGFIGCEWEREGAREREREREGCGEENEPNFIHQKDKKNYKSIMSCGTSSGEEGGALIS